MLNMENEQDHIKLDAVLLKKLNEALESVTVGEGVEYDADVTLFLVDDGEIRRINLEYRSIDAPTDVLSFPVIRYEEGNIFSESYDEANLTDDMFLGDSLLLGDIFLSGERAQAQSLEYGHSLLREVVFLFVHSLLHLLGYDHMTEEDRLRMEARQEHYMTEIGVERD